MGGGKGDTSNSHIIHFIQTTEEIAPQKDPVRKQAGHDERGIYNSGQHQIAETFPTVVMTDIFS